MTMHVLSTLKSFTKATDSLPATTFNVFSIGTSMHACYIIISFDIGQTILIVPCLQLRIPKTIELYKILYKANPIFPLICIRSISLYSQLATKPCRFQVRFFNQQLKKWRRQNNVFPAIARSVALNTEEQMCRMYFYFGFSSLLLSMFLQVVATFKDFPNN